MSGGEGEAAGWLPSLPLREVEVLVVLEMLAVLVLEEASSGTVGVPADKKGLTGHAMVMTVSPAA